MLSSFKSLWFSLVWRAKVHLQVKRPYRRKNHRLLSEVDFLTTSFAAMELSGQFKQVFKVIDANGDGMISPVELSEVLFCLGYDKSAAMEEAQGMVREMDCNGDGLIDLDEFMHAVDADEEFCSSKDEDYLMDAFLIFDSDRNGLISAKELRRVLISLGFRNCSLRECKRMISGVDKDGDGYVDFDEFRSMMSISARSNMRQKKKETQHE